MEEWDQMATFDSGLKLTQAGIPVSLRPFFQEYALEDLDPEHNAPEARELLAILGQLPFLRPFYLAECTSGSFQKFLG